VPVAVAFARGSAVLPEGAQAALASVAGQRAGRDVWVVGYGESDDDDPAVQAGALRLAFARARSLMAGLAQAGVPVEAMLVRAEALGRGGVARIAE
jgi:outer membrane protein OmpA-like peptidoglycan-associated protein